MRHIPMANRDHNDAWITCSCGWGTFGNTGEDWLEHAEEFCPPVKQVQSSGPACKKCGRYTTYRRVNTHGLCLRCETESDPNLNQALNQADGFYGTES